MILAPVLECEEPLRPNPSLTAFDEASESLSLAEFGLEGVCRYTFKWPQRQHVLELETEHFLHALQKMLPQPGVCIAGWRHGVPDDLRMRHRLLASRLLRSCWGVEAQTAIGVALKPVAAGELPQALAELNAAGHAGWFLAFGGWVSAKKLHEPPYLATIQSFCWTHRLQPSREFLEGLRKTGGSVVYLVTDDMGPHRVVVVTSRPMGSHLSHLVPDA